jgi:integrase/recombinase XerD
MTITDCLPGFKEHLQTIGRNPKTVSAYLTDLAQFAEWYPHPIGNLRTDDIERYKIALVDRRRSVITINRKLITIRQIIIYANRDRQAGIFADVKLFKQQRQAYLEDNLTKGEFDRIAEAAAEAGDKQALALLHTLFRTGGRISELLQMRVGDIRHDYAQVVGKGGKIRDLFITDRLRAFTWDYINGRPDEEPLFINQRNRGPMSRQTAGNIIRKYAGHAKVKLSKAHPHGFRHLFCLNLAENGMGDSDIAELAGHANVNTTRIYTRQTKEQIRRRINKLD